VYTTSGIAPGASLKITLEAAGETPIVLATAARNVGYFMWATDPDVTFTGRLLRVADAMDSSAFGLTGAFDASAPAAQISVGTTPSGVWEANKEVKITWSSTGVVKTEKCFVEIWALSSSYTGARWAANVTGIGGVTSNGALKYPDGVPCGEKPGGGTGRPGVEWTPPTTLSVTVKYFAFVITADGTVAGRSEPASLNGGAEPDGLGAVVSSSRRRIRALSASRRRSRILSAARELPIDAQAFPDISGPQAAIIGATSCSACVTAGGAWVLDTGYKFTFELAGGPDDDGEEKEILTALGEHDAQESFCWFKPESGQSEAVREFKLGRTAATTAKASELLPGLTAKVVLKLSENVKGSTTCTANEAVKTPISVDLTPLAAEAGGARMLQAEGSADGLEKILCDQLKAAIAAAGGANTDVSKTSCSVAEVNTVYTTTQKTNRLLSDYGRDLSTCTCPTITTTQVPGSSTASIVVTAAVGAGQGDAAASGVNSQAGTPTPGARGLSVGHWHRELEVRLLGGARRTVKAKVGAAKVSKPNGPKKGVKVAKVSKKGKKAGTKLKKGGTLRKRTGGVEPAPGLPQRALTKEEEHKEYARRLADATTLRDLMKAGTASNPQALAAQAANRLPALSFNAAAAGSPAPTPTRTPFPSASKLALRSGTRTPSRTATPSSTKLPAGASQSPTPTPSPFPSASPQAVVVALTLPAGTTAITLSSLSADAKALLIDALSATLSVSPDSVTIIGVRAVESRRLLAETLTIRRRLAVTGYAIDFAVSTGAVTSAAAAAALVQGAITSGALPSSLAATDLLASELGVSRAVLSSPTVYSATAALVAAAAPSPVPVPDSFNSNVAAIVGGVVGGVGGVALLAIVYYFMANAASAGKATGKTLELRQIQAS